MNEGAMQQQHACIKRGEQSVARPQFSELQRRGLQPKVRHATGS